MELFALLVFGGFCVLVVGAIMGMIAKARTNELAARLQAVEEELRVLRRERRTGQVVPPKAASASPWRTESEPESEPEPEPELPPEPEPERELEPEPEPLPPWRLATSTPPPLPPAIAPSTLPSPPLPPLPPPPQPAPPPLASPEPAAAAPDADTPPAPGRFEGVEKALGLRGLTWIGTGMLFLGVAFFLKYAYDRDWLGNLFGPRLRIATAAAAALVLAATGWRSLRNGMQALGQGLLGGGQALLYLTIYAAFQPAAMVVDTPLLGTTAAFALMAGVTIVGLAVAVRLDAIAMAFLAVLGGLATPVLVGSGQDSRDALCAYLLLLDLGVLLVASYRRWRALDLLAFVGTVVLFGGWYRAWHHMHPQPDATIVWLGVFHLVFVLLPFAHHWRHRTAVTVERFALALANLAWTLGYASWMLREEAPGLLAAGCFGGTALYLALGLVTARRVGDDRRTRDGFLALATLLLTVGFLFLLPANGITTAWFVEASVLLWLGHRHAHTMTRQCALAVLVVAMLRTLVVHLPAVDRTAGLVWHPWFVTLLVASGGLFVFAWIHARFTTAAGDRGIARALGIGAGLWTLLACTLEIGRHATGHADAWTMVTPALAIAWLQIAGSLAFLLWAVRWSRTGTFHAAFLPLLASAIAVGVAYESYAADAWPVGNGCFVAGLAVCAVLVLAGRWSRRCVPDVMLASSLFGTAQMALTALATVEAAVWLQRGGAEPAPQTMGQVLGQVWLGCAFGGVLAGVARTSQRMLALAAIPLAMAVFVGLWQFGHDLVPHRLIANQRFLFAMLCAGVVAGLRLPLRRVGLPVGGDHAAAAGFCVLLLYASCESVTWSLDTRRGEEIGRWMTWLLGVTAVAGSAGGWWRARATQNRSLRGLALATLAPAMVVPLVVHVTGWQTDWMFGNLRAALVAAAVATALLWTRGDANLRPLRWLAFVVGLVGVTAEPPAWFFEHVAERAEATRLALFAVTVTWVVVAVGMLVVGFRRNLRTVRLVALGLFALTAVKVLLLDMSGAQQLYRILAFVLVGLVFVGASWLYHRVERRFLAK